MQTDATRTCELLVGLRDVTVLGVDERLRQPDEGCVDLQHPWIHRPIAIPEGSGAPFDAVIKVGHAPEVPSFGVTQIGHAERRRQTGSGRARSTVLGSHGASFGIEQWRNRRAERMCSHRR